MTWLAPVLQVLLLTLLLSYSVVNRPTRPTELSESVCRDISDIWSVCLVDIPIVDLMLENCQVLNF